jgi:hypothetical protein
VGEADRYFLARRWNRVRFSIFLCFFLRMRLRRFLINDPMAGTEDSGPTGVGVIRRPL